MNVPNEYQPEFEMWWASQDTEGLSLACKWAAWNAWLAATAQQSAGFIIGPNDGDKWRCTHCGAPAEDEPKAGGIVVSPALLDVLVCVAQVQRGNRALSATAIHYLEEAEGLLSQLPQD